MIIGTIITVLCDTSYSQCDFNIHFEFHHSRRIPYRHIVIEMTQKCMTDSAIITIVSSPYDTISNKWNYSKIDTTIEISRNDFENIINSVKQIKNVEIDYNPNILVSQKDGTICIIGYGNSQDYVSFRFWSPDYKTEDRKLQEFLSACKQILTIANLDPKEIL